MPQFQLFDLVRWIHIVAMALGGGAAVVALLISGLEDDREDLRGLSASLWKLFIVWVIRIGFVVGVVLLAMQAHAGAHPFDARYLLFKLPMAVLMLAVSEVAAPSLARARRGAALLVVLLFLLASFMAVNGEAFGRKFRPSAPAQLTVLPEAK